MSRTIKTANRPADHVLIEDPDVPADHNGKRFCCAVVASTQGGLRRCALREDDSVHVTSEQLQATAEDVSSRIVGEHDYEDIWGPIADADEVGGL